MDDFSMQGNENNNNRTRKIYLAVLISVSILCIIILVVALISGSKNAPEDSLSAGDTDAYSYSYAGENDDWTAEYAVAGVGEWTDMDDTLGYDGSYNTLLTISFKKDPSELPSTRHLIFSYKLNNSGGTLDETYDEDRTVRSSYSFTSDINGMFIYSEGDVFTVTFSLDGVEQTIEMNEVK